jgi:hypothetical protein
MWQEPIQEKSMYNISQQKCCTQKWKEWPSWWSRIAGGKNMKIEDEYQIISVEKYSNKWTNVLRSKYYNHETGIWHFNLVKRVFLHYHAKKYCGNFMKSREHNNFFHVCSVAHLILASIKNLIIGLLIQPCFLCTPLRFCRLAIQDCRRRTNKLIRGPEHRACWPSFFSQKYKGKKCPTCFSIF